MCFGTHLDSCTYNRQGRRRERQSARGFAHSPVEFTMHLGPSPEFRVRDHAISKVLQFVPQPKDSLPTFLVSSAQPGYVDSSLQGVHPDQQREMGVLVSALAPETSNEIMTPVHEPTCVSG